MSLREILLGSIPGSELLHTSKTAYSRGLCSLDVFTIKKYKSWSKRSFCGGKREPHILLPDKVELNSLMGYIFIKLHFYDSRL